MLVDAYLDDLLDDLFAAVREHDSALYRIMRARDQRRGPDRRSGLAIVGMHLGHEVVERG